MQIDNKFTAIWYDTSSAPGVALTGLSATITIRDKSTNTIVVNNEAMTEIGNGEYDYTFTGMSATKTYSYVMNPNSGSAFVETGFVDPRMANLDAAITDIRTGGGGSGISSQAIQTSISNAKRALEKKIEDEHQTTREIIKLGNNDTNSHIELAKQDINDKIESIPEIDLNDVKSSLSTIKTQNTKLSNYLKTEQEKEKEEMMKMHESEMKEMQDKIDEMEDVYEESMKLNEEEKMGKESEKEQIMKDAEEYVKVLEEEISKTKVEALDKIKSLIQ